MLIANRHSAQAGPFSDIERNAFRPLCILRRRHRHGVTGLLSRRMCACTVLIGHELSPFRQDA
jgi:hypothetical protein